jgi:hypothetical protein
VRGAEAALIATAAKSPSAAENRRNVFMGVWLLAVLVGTRRRKPPAPGVVGQT